MSNIKNFTNPHSGEEVYFVEISEIGTFPQNL